MLGIVTSIKREVWDCDMINKRWKSIVHLCVNASIFGIGRLVLCRDRPTPDNPCKLAPSVCTVRIFLPQWIVGEASKRVKFDCSNFQMNPIAKYSLNAFWIFFQGAKTFSWLWWTPWSGFHNWNPFNLKLNYFILSKLYYYDISL